MFISCKEAARLESEARDRQLSTMERVGLGFHMLMCKMCRLYRTQIDLISRISRQAGDMVMNRPDRALAPDVKDRIKQRLTHPSSD